MRIGKLASIKELAWLACFFNSLALAKVVSMRSLWTRWLQSFLIKRFLFSMGLLNLLPTLSIFERRFDRKIWLGEEGSEEILRISSRDSCMSVLIGDI